VKSHALLGALLADHLLGDPQRGHPVAGFGRLARRVESAWWRDSRFAGAGYAAVCAGLPTAAAALLERRTVRRGCVLTVVLWTTLGGRSLVRVARSMEAFLDAGRLADARIRLGHLCARDGADLDAPEIVRATIESVAENTSDAVVAPLFWALVGGSPAVVAYRAVNTLDAMVGYRSERYERFGWAAARADDALNIVPSRICAALACVLAPVVGGSPRQAWAVLCRDGASHPSPNAGRPEAAFAGALGVRLGGVNSYDDVREVRGTLGDGDVPGVKDIERAARLSTAVGITAAAVFAGVAGVLR
jgi:adenosylcobinamide-phosphate synthase